MIFRVALICPLLATWDKQPNNFGLIKRLSNDERHILAVVRLCFTKALTTYFRALRPIWALQLVSFFIQILLFAIGAQRRNFEEKKLRFAH